MEQPKWFNNLKDKFSKVLFLLKSLYGLKQVPIKFFEKLRAGLLERDFEKSDFNKCHFMKKDMICVVYVDDTIICGPDSGAIEVEILGLRVSKLEQHHKFEL